MTRWHPGTPGTMKGKLEIIERRHEEPWSWADLQERDTHELLDALAEFCRTKVVRWLAVFWLAFVAVRASIYFAWGI